MDRQTATIVAPLFLLFALGFPTLVLARCATWVGWAARVWLVSGLAALLWLCADWSWASVHLRYLLLLHVALACARSGQRVRRAAVGAEGGTRAFGAVMTSLACVAALACTSALLQLGRDGAGVVLRWPLDHPRGYVLQGGSSPLLNQHASVHAQERALDIGALSAWGRRSRGWFSQSCSDYEVYGRSVRAPCDGEVLAARAGEPERAPFAPPLERRIAGNFVLLFCREANVTVLLAHLQAELAVQRDERVRSGQALGRVGNSGNTSEPHLHVHAVRGRVESADIALSSAEPVALLFQGAAARRGDVLGP